MTKIEKQARECVKVMEDNFLKINWEEPKAYADWLAQTFYYVRHATRVLAKAAWRCHLDDEDLHKRLLKGINEEKNHEIMCINDIKRIGYKIEDFQEYAETSAYYQTLYHLIDYHGPYELLGYFVNLEGLGAIGTDQAYDRIIAAHGEKSASFLKVHAKIDAGHFDEGLKHLNTLTDDQLKIVSHGLEISTSLYCNLLKRIALEQPQSKRQSA